MKHNLLDVLYFQSRLTKAISQRVRNVRFTNKRKSLEGSSGESQPAAKQIRLSFTQSSDGLLSEETFNNHLTSMSTEMRKAAEARDDKHLHILVKVPHYTEFLHNIQLHGNKCIRDQRMNG